jgi:hypothetical protein
VFTRSLAILCTLLALECGQDSPLTREEMNKLDPGLRQLFVRPSPASSGQDSSAEHAEPSDAGYDVTVRADGTKEYGVIIHSSSPQDLRDAGIHVGSVFGEIVTARVSVQELRRILPLPTVRSVEQGNRTEIQR